MSPIETAAATSGPAYEEWNRRFMAGEAIEPAARFVTRAALESLAQHRDDIARVLHEHSHRMKGSPHCSCGWDGASCMDHRGHQAAAVLAYLTGETR